jgi:peptide/nickel transport system permease protein
MTVERIGSGDAATATPPRATILRMAGSRRARLGHDPRGILGLVLVAAVVAIALLGPLIAPFDPGDFAGRPFEGPTGAHPLGLDVLGRDVLSAVLSGGAVFLAEAVAATLIGVGLGTLVGVSLALTPRRASELLLAVNDTVLVLPQIIVALLVLTRLGATPVTLVGVIAFVHVPQTARVVLVATQKVVREDYFAAAQGIGMRRRGLVVHEILPNIAGVVGLEFGIRLAISSVVLASLSYLGFGSTQVEWGRMIHDNQGGLTFQPWAVMAPVLVLGAFLIGANLVRDSLARSTAAR